MYYPNIGINLKYLYINQFKLSPKSMLNLTSRKRGRGLAKIFIVYIINYYSLVFLTDKSIKVFSTIPVAGTKIKNQAKYRKVET